MPYTVDTAVCRDYARSSRLEWCLTNGLGGYAMSTISGANTRRYHGLLVSAIQPPATRMVLLSSIEAYVSYGADTYGISTNQYVQALHPMGYSLLQNVVVGDTVESIFDLGGNIFKRRVKMHPGKNAVTVEYENLSDSPCQLSLRPLVCHKFYHDNFRLADHYPEFLLFPEDRTVLAHQNVTLYLEHEGADRAASTGWYYRFENERELDRGLDPIDDLFCPCELRYLLSKDEMAVVRASSDEVIEKLPATETENASTTIERLKQAAQKFIVQTEDRFSVIAGYPWFTDWGRDTMISLPGCFLHTGRVADARKVLTSFALQMRQGLIPNRFVEVGEKTDYNTVDATLWFANAIYKTLLTEWDQDFAAQAYAWLGEVVHWHRQGTRYGIGMDASDGLLTQGEDGVQLTWMDAKVGDWVVTPRHGKPVEVNALWVNLLRVAEWLGNKLGKDTGEYAQMAQTAETSFAEKFWHPVLGHYLDTVDPGDASLRPNQVIAMALPFSPCKPDHAKAALAKVEEKLYTTVGLRTLGPDEPGYKGRFEGDMPQRDAAYHQGTAWPWLLGSYATALVKFGGDKAKAAQVLANADELLQQCGIAGISEVYDGDEPRNPGGCPWQAWSAAEYLRALVEDLQQR